MPTRILLASSFLLALLHKAENMCQRIQQKLSNQNQTMEVP